MGALGEAITQGSLTAARFLNSSPSIEGARPACYKDFNVIEIPDVMNRVACPVGARLMSRWFQMPAFQMPVAWKTSKVDQRAIPSGIVDAKIVTMKWALNFPRAISAYRELRSIIWGPKTESLRKSKDELFHTLRADGKFTNRPQSFGGTRLSALDLHETAHMNRRLVGENLSGKIIDPLDDLYCALGAFNIHLAASGTVQPIQGTKLGHTTHQVKIDRLGFYVRDCYDFNNEQLLGFWGANGVSRVPGAGLYTIENSTFRGWRAKHGRGGDFIVFSDVLWEPAPAHLVWDYPL